MWHVPHTLVYSSARTHCFVHLQIMKTKFALFLLVLLGFGQSVVSAALWGDANNSGTVTTADITSIRQHILGQRSLSPEAIARADVNGDGWVTTLDIVLIRDFILGRPAPGNRTGRVVLEQLYTFSVSSQSPMVVTAGEQKLVAVFDVAPVAIPASWNYFSLVELVDSQSRYVVRNSWLSYAEAVIDGVIVSSVGPFDTYGRWWVDSDDRSWSDRFFSFQPIALECPVVFPAPIAIPAGSGVQIRVYGTVPAGIITDTVIRLDRLVFSADGQGGDIFPGITVGHYIR